MGKGLNSFSRSRAWVAFSMVPNKGWGRAVVQSGNIIYRTDRQHPLQLRVYGME